MLNQILLCKCQTIFRFQSCSRTAKACSQEQERENLGDKFSFSLLLFPLPSPLFFLLGMESGWGFALYPCATLQDVSGKGMESKHFPRFLKKSPTYSLPGGIREMVPEVWWERFHPGRYNNLAAG